MAWLGPNTRNDPNTARLTRHQYILLIAIFSLLLQCFYINFSIDSKFLAPLDDHAFQLEFDYMNEESDPPPDPDTSLQAKSNVILAPNSNTNTNINTNSSTSTNTSTNDGDSHEEPHKQEEPEKSDNQEENSKVDDGKGKEDGGTGTEKEGKKDADKAGVGEGKAKKDTNAGTKNDKIIEGQNAKDDADNAAVETNEVKPGRKLASIQCEKFGGADPAVADDMVYWYDIPSDAQYVNPFQKSNQDKGREQFLIFEKDPAGFNNFRMSLETIITLGISMGRTIVLPPEQPMYLWNKEKNKEKKQKNRFSFQDFYHLKEIEAEHPAIRIITMDQFLKQADEEGIFKDRQTGEKLQIPKPEGTQSWDEAQGDELDELYTWLSKNAFHLSGWDSNYCYAFWPQATDPNSTSLERIQKMMEFDPKPTRAQFVGHPVPVNASAKERLEEHINEGGRPLCHYNQTMQDAQIIVSTHTWEAGEKGETGNRFLSPFYTFHFYENWEQALWTRRFVRDHFRYHDDLMCAAARVVASIRQRVRARGLPHSANGTFNTVHIRRGDFQSQYPATQLPAEKLYNLSKAFLEPNSTVFIATDAKKKDFFEPFVKNYDVVFLDDFKDEIEGVNSNYYGILDQIIASKGEVFLGTFWSTLSAYVNRMRGYYSIRDKIDGYKDGTLKSYYFMPNSKRRVMTKYFPPSDGLWAHEFPTAWRDIDRGIPEL